MKKSSIGTKVTGFAVIETVSVDIDLNDEDRKLFKTNPEQIIEKLLKEAGHEVNSITMMKNKHVGNITTEARANWYHIVYPDNEKSGWFCCCAD